VTPTDIIKEVFEKRLKHASRELENLEDTKKYFAELLAEEKHLIDRMPILDDLESIQQEIDWQKMIISQCKEVLAFIREKTI
jgi:deoxyadenosine/deoxycytidine kinase